MARAAAECGIGVRVVAPGSIPKGLAIDFQFEQTAAGHNLKLLHVVDEFTREALSIECRRRIDADHTIKVLDRLVVERGRAPGLIPCDNGPELTANALRDWCRFYKAGSAYRAGLAVAEPVRRELRLPHPGRSSSPSSPS